MVFIDFTDKGITPEFPTEGLVIIEYSMPPHSTRYKQFKQEIHDLYFQKFNKQPDPVPDVSCSTVLCLLYSEVQ